ncbi:hypothetical protein [Corynebacterium variabile]|uniref:hypothetical protein n=1 Tax=Corynebacterium variabile TaxID=1727 RepID=UPI003FD4CBD1
MALDITAGQVREYGVEITDAAAELMIGDAIALAEAAAPGVTELTGQKLRAAEAIIRGAVVRWAESGGNGGVTQEQGTDVLGPFTHTTSQSYSTRKSMYFPSEERALQKLVAADEHRVFAVDLAPTLTHRPCGTCVPGTCLNREGVCW